MGTARASEGMEGEKPYSEGQRNGRGRNRAGESETREVRVGEEGRRDRCRGRRHTLQVWCPREERTRQVGALLRYHSSQELDLNFVWTPHASQEEELKRRVSALTSVLVSGGGPEHGRPDGASVRGAAGAHLVLQSQLPPVLQRDVHHQPHRDLAALRLLHHGEALRGPTRRAALSVTSRHVSVT